MTTKITPVRLTKKDLEYIDEKVRNGEYASRSDAIRTAIRLMGLYSLIGIGGDAKENSVGQVRKIRDNSKINFNSYEEFRKQINDELKGLPRFNK